MRSSMNQRRGLVVVRRLNSSKADSVTTVNWIFEQTHPDSKKQRVQRHAEGQTHTNETGLSGPLHGADAFKTVHQVHAHAAVIARVRTAVIFIWGRGGDVSLTYEKADLSSLRQCRDAYWCCRTAQSSPAHTDTQSPDWTPHNCLRSDTAQTDRRYPLQRARERDVILLYSHTIKEKLRQNSIF